MNDTASAGEAIAFVPVPKNPRFVDLTGRRFERWTVLGYAGKVGPNGHWHCQCDCGTIKMVFGGSLTYGTTRSCGCLSSEVTAAKNFRHGKSKQKVYRVWCGMRRRCTDPKEKQYADYGGRGITVCPEWKEFVNFYADMGDIPFARADIDRIDNESGYCKANCRWTTRTENCRNKRNNRVLEHQGRRLCLAEWVEVTGLERGTIRDRLDRGWSVADALRPIEPRR